MYTKSKSIHLKSSASLLYNNLSTLIVPDKDIITYAVVHKAVANLSNCNVHDESTSVTHKQVSCKDPSITTHASHLLQAKFCTLTGRTLLVLCSQHGIQMFESDGSAMVFWYALPAADSTQGLLFTRGVGVLPGNIVAVDGVSTSMGHLQLVAGITTSLRRFEKPEILPAYAMGGYAPTEDAYHSVILRALGGGTGYQTCWGALHATAEEFSVYEGSILIFKVPPQGTNVVLHETLRCHEYPITAIGTEGKVMASADDSGCITVWETIQDQIGRVSKINGGGSSCSSVVVYRQTVIGGYGSGHIRIFDAFKGTMMVEICAHARWIHAMDLAPSTGLLISTSEDCFVRVWSLLKKEDDVHIMLEHTEHVADTQLTGVQFLDSAGQSFCVSGYDSNVVVQYTKA